MYEFENDNAVYARAYGTFVLMFDLVGDTDAKDVDASSTTFVKVEQDLGLPIDEETKVSDCDSRDPVKVEQNMREGVHSAESDMDGSSGGRFAPPTSDQDFTDILKEIGSKHTRKNTMRSLRILTEWCRTNDIPECTACQEMYSVRHVLIYCIDLGLIRPRYYTVRDLKTLFDTVSVDRILSL